MEGIAENTKRKRKGWVIAVIALCCVIGLVALVLLGAIGYFKLSVASYYSASQKEFVLPDIGEGFVPQGIHYDADRNCFLITGYSSEDEASPVYTVDRTGSANDKKVLLMKEDGTPFKGHAGGIAAWGDSVYIAGGDDRCLYVFSYSEIIAASDGGAVSCKGSFSTEASDSDYIDISFVTVHGDRIIVGEFYRAESYPTLESHKLTTAAGDYNQALAVEFALSADAEYGIVPTPLAAYSLTDNVQGLCISGDNLYLSTSYGVSFSHIYEYDMTKLGKSKINVLGAEVPLYEADSASLVHEYKIAPMSEEIIMLDGRLYVMCESASNKYKFGKLIGGKWCYSTALEEMKK